MRNLLLALLTSVVLSMAIVSTSPAASVGNFSVIEGEIGGIRSAAWQPGQFLLVFYVEDMDVPVSFVGNTQSNITNSKLSVWQNRCAQEIGYECRIIGIYPLDNPVGVRESYYCGPDANDCINRR